MSVRLSPSFHHTKNRRVSQVGRASLDPRLIVRSVLLAERGAEGTSRGSWRFVGGRRLWAERARLDLTVERFKRLVVAYHVERLERLRVAVGVIAGAQFMPEPLPHFRAAQHVLGDGWDGLH